MWKCWAMIYSKLRLCCVLSNIEPNSLFKGLEMNTLQALNWPVGRQKKKKNVIQIKPCTQENMSDNFYLSGEFSILSLSRMHRVLVFLPELHVETHMWNISHIKAPKLRSKVTQWPALSVTNMQWNPIVNRHYTNQKFEVRKILVRCRLPKTASIWSKIQ